MDLKFEELVGKTLVGIENEGERIIMEDSDGIKYVMYHSQDCCESVDIDGIEGELKDLIGSPIVQAEESSNEDQGQKHEYDESYTWTFYRLATKDARVVIRWYGTSNGYYSESVSFERVV